MPQYPLVPPVKRSPKRLVPAQAVAVLRLAGWKGGDLMIITAIVMTENTPLDAHAVGGPNRDGSYDFGLCQVNSVHNPSESQKFNFNANASLAHKIYADAGNKFTPWSTFNSGKFRTNIPKAMAALREAGIKPPYDSPDGNAADGLTPTIKDLAPLVPTLPDIPGAIGTAIGALNAQVSKISGNIATIILAVVFLILGVVILIRMPVSKTVTTVAKAVK